MRWRNLDAPPRPGRAVAQPCAWGADCPCQRARLVESWRAAGGLVAISAHIAAPGIVALPGLPPLLALPAVLAASPLGDLVADGLVARFWATALDPAWHAQSAALLAAAIAAVAGG